MRRHFSVGTEPSEYPPMIKNWSSKTVTEWPSRRVKSPPIWLHVCVRVENWAIVGLST